MQRAALTSLPYEAVYDQQPPPKRPNQGEVSLRIAHREVLKMDAMFRSCCKPVEAKLGLEARAMREREGRRDADRCRSMHRVCCGLCYVARKRDERENSEEWREGMGCGGYRPSRSGIE